MTLQPSPVGETRYLPIPNNNPQAEISLVTQTSPTIIFERIEHRLKGERYDEQSSEWVESTGLRQMNDKGINAVMTDVEASVNFIWSNLRTDDEVMRVVNRLGKTITRKIAANWKEWEIDKSSMSSLVLFVCHQALASTRRGYMSGEREFLKKNVIEHHSTQQLNQQQPTSNKKHFWEVWKK